MFQTAFYLYLPVFSQQILYYFDRLTNQLPTPTLTMESGQSIQSGYAAPTLYVSPLLSAWPTMAATAAAKPLRVMYFCGISWAFCVKV